MNKNPFPWKNVDLIVDMQYGSTGKGLIAGYLSMKRKYDVVVNANMPNAGHTCIDDYGNVMIHKVLPNGLINPHCVWALLGPGSVFSLDRLIEEIDTLYSYGYKHFMVGIHPNAVLLRDDHKTAEQSFLRIGSTAQGSAAALMEKMARDPERNPTVSAVLGDGLHHPSIQVLTIDEYNHILKGAKSILVEGAQGFSLGINQRFYPYATSRECGPERFLSDTGVPLRGLREVIGTARTYPIRVGSPASGYSGDVYPDQKEVTWDEVGVPPEYTTVTNRERRVFTFSQQQIDDAIWAMSVDKVFLNFANYVNDFDPIVWNEKLDDRLWWIGRGPMMEHIEEWGVPF